MYLATCSHDKRMDSVADQVWLLSAAGQEMVYVNGEPRPGDPYSNGIRGSPIKPARRERFPFPGSLLRRRINSGFAGGRWKSPDG
jgi:hypothetical protein